jgi:hypothetical protein
MCGGRHEKFNASNSKESNIETWSGESRPFIADYADAHRIRGPQSRGKIHLCVML